MAQQPPVGVAIIGSGIFVKSQHLVRRRASVQAKLTAAAGGAGVRAAGAQGHLLAHAAGGRGGGGADPRAGAGPAAELYADDAGPGRFDAVLARADVAGVIVALPIVAQPGFVAAALRAGKHVLAEKPLAPDVAAARALVAGPGAAERLSVAENVRFQARLAYAAGAVRRLGRVTHFGVRVMGMMAADGKWCATAWRREPAHQGGFLLDGGVHHAAATRLLLGSGEPGTGESSTGESSTGQPDNRPRAVAAFTACVTDHLRPVDSVAAIVTTAAGATGTLQHSVGSRTSAFEWDVACERGAVRVAGDMVTVREEGQPETAREFARETGVPAEVAAWAAGAVSGERDRRLAPAEVLADLEFVEAMLAERRAGRRAGRAAAAGIANACIQS